jgi:hypothetical protein
LPIWTSNLDKITFLDTSLYVMQPLIVHLICMGVNQITHIYKHQNYILAFFNLKFTVLNICIIFMHYDFFLDNFIHYDLVNRKCLFSWIITHEHHFFSSRKLDIHPKDRLIRRNQSHLQLTNIVIGFLLFFGYLIGFL